MTTIRQATTLDKARLIELATRFLVESRYGALFTDSSPAQIGTLIDNVLTLGTILVAEVVEDRSNDVREYAIVGMLAIVALPHPLAGGTVAEEIAWWVEPEYRGGTLGPKMLREAEDWATRNGAVMVKMVAPAGSTVGNFYERIGYEAVETAYIKPI